MSEVYIQEFYAQRVNVRALDERVADYLSCKGLVRINREPLNVAYMSTEATAVAEIAANRAEFARGEAIGEYLLTIGSFDKMFLDDFSKRFPELRARDRTQKKSSS